MLTTENIYDLGNDQNAPRAVGDSISPNKFEQTLAEQIRAAREAIANLGPVTVPVEHSMLNRTDSNPDSGSEYLDRLHAEITESTSPTSMFEAVLPDSSNVGTVKLNGYRACRRRQVAQASIVGRFR